MSAIYTTVAGRMATAPERYVTDRGPRVRFRVASTERRYNRTGDGWADAETVYLTVTCWRQLADSVHQSLRVGDPVIVHGKLSSHSYERDGRPQTLLELGADAVGPDLRWSTAVVTRTRSAAAEAPRVAGADEREAPTSGEPRVPSGEGAPAPHDRDFGVGRDTGAVERRAVEGAVSA